MLNRKFNLMSNITQYFNIIPTLLLQFGHIVFDEIKISKFITEDKISELIYKIRKGSVIIFNHKSDLLENGISSIKELITFNDSFEKIFSNEDLSLYTYDGTIYDNSEKQINFFINQKRIYKSKKDYSDFLKSFYILTEQEINEISVPDYLLSNYYYLFLQNSGTDR